MLALVGLLAAGQARADHASGGSASGTPHEVRTDAGALRGYANNGVSTFRGIPYAAPPVGDLRWKPPAAVQPWSSTRDAAAFGNSCVQTVTYNDFAEKSSSEDCLYLNVFAPAETGGAPKPVMVWIHGGSLINGRGDDYDGRALARDGNVVVVTLNYRLNVFGFLAHPQLDTEGHPSANYGLMDQQFALAWVKRNIAAFGGDPANVTLFGESAGGLAVLFNMISPPAAGLFHKVILQSAVSASPQVAPEAAQKIGTDFANAVGCGDQTAACLRSQSAETITTKAAAFTRSATRSYDGTIMRQPLQQALADGNFHKVPVIIGNNHDEYTWFVGLTELASGNPLSAEEYPRVLERTYGAERGAKILAEYPLDRFSSPSEALAAAQTSWGFVCPSQRAMRSLARHVPVYAYEFMDRTAPHYFKSVSFPYHAAHTLDIQYLFSRYHGASGKVQLLSADQQRLSADMVSYWTTFAAKGDPNSSKTPAWPTFVPGETLQRLDLPRPSTVTSTGIDRKCEFWDRL
jgi:para-nitrobenzyl esterase